MHRRRVGHALVCVDARFASVLWDGAKRIDRRFVSARDWLALQNVLADTLELGPLPADGVISEALLPPDRRVRVIVQYLYRPSVEDRPGAALELDQILTALAHPSLRMDQE